MYQKLLIFQNVYGHFEKKQFVAGMSIISIFAALAIHESETIDMDSTAADAPAELLVGMAMDCF